MEKNFSKVKVIGGGLAGCEASYFLAEHGIFVELYECKPKKYSPAHKSPYFAELVCSNSLKSNDMYSNACGLLKEEMRIMHSITMQAATYAQVPAGAALAVDREKFSKFITEKIKNHPNICIKEEEVTKLFTTDLSIVATGPLTLDSLAEHIQKYLGGKLYFFDAAAPIIESDSIHEEYTFTGNRYGKYGSDYLNCPMTQEQYDKFVYELVHAEKVVLHPFEKGDFFEGCMPIEELARRGKDALRFAMLKPVGLVGKDGQRPYAVLQLRKENAEGSAYNLVGCQTNLKFLEQKRVFGIIPALQNASYLRYGVMHRNSYLNAPKVLNSDYSCKINKKLYFAGQITGVEGYVESAASGLVAAINLYCAIRNRKLPVWNAETMLGALAQYITTPRENFQPMNANYGILAPLDIQVQDKAMKRQIFAERAMHHMHTLSKVLSY